MALKYTKKVLDHFLHPRNMGELKDADAEATDGSPACGDMITFGIKVDPKSLRITDIKFKSYGCASNIATASMITELAKGKTLKEAKAMGWKAAADELGGLPPVKMHCSLLAERTLVAAIKKYEEAHGLAKHAEAELTHDAVMQELQTVINPEIGINLVRLKMVKSVSITGGAVRVEISLGNTDKLYADNIREEIDEHVRSLKGVKSVEVSFKN